MVLRLERPPRRYEATAERRGVVRDEPGRRRVVRLLSAVGVVMEEGGGSGEPFRSIRTIFETTRKRAGLGEDITPHVCRHTFGSRLAMAGKDVRTIQELMGHKRIEMTIRYTQVSDEHKAAAVRTALVPPKIPQPFSQQAPGEGGTAVG